MSTAQLTKNSVHRLMVSCIAVMAFTMVMLAQDTTKTQETVGAATRTVEVRSRARAWHMVFPPVRIGSRSLDGAA